MSDKYINFETRKNIHFSMTRETHSDFRVACFKKRLTMQDILEEFAQMVAAEHPTAIKIMDNLAEKKRNDEISRLTKTDSESILNVISELNPLKDDAGDNSNEK